MVNLNSVLWLLIRIWQSACSKVIMFFSLFNFWDFFIMPDTVHNTTNMATITELSSFFWYKLYILINNIAVNIINFCLLSMSQFIFNHKDKLLNNSILLFRGILKFNVHSCNWKVGKPERKQAGGCLHCNH